MKRIILLILVCLGLALAGCAKPSAHVKATPTPISTPKKTPAKPVTTPKKAVTKPTPKVTVTPKPTKKLAPKKPSINCLLCHTKAKYYPPHEMGGKYCLKCHGKKGMTVAQVAHSIHKGVISCEVCHGKPPNLHIPKPIYPNQSVCVDCHNPKNPTKPCTNLVTIHLGRGLYCTVCHTQPISVIHKAANQYAVTK